MRLILYIATLSVIFAGPAASLPECETTVNCAPSTATCVNSFCQCPPGEVFNSDNTKCIKVVNKMEGSCEVNAQCAIISGPVSCREGKCQCPEDHVYLKRQCIYKKLNDDVCTSNDQCFDGLDYNSRVCQKGQCKCAEGYYDRSGIDCRRKAALEEACSLNMDCQDENTFCDNKKCRKIGSGRKNIDISYQEDDIDDNRYDNVTIIKSILKDGKALNEACSSGDTCADTNAICNTLSYTCLCRNGYFEQSKKCVAELGMKCTDASECGNKMLCEKGVCTCEAGNHYSTTNTICRGTAYQIDGGLKCSTAVSCRILNAHFDCPNDKLCKCNKGFKLDDDFICRASCSRDYDCEKANQICDATNTCVCGPEYLLTDGECKPRIGGVCTTSTECTEMVPNSVCNKICMCVEGYVDHEYECYKEVEMGGECVQNVQCARKWNSTCGLDNDKKICKCDTGYLNVGGNCLRIATHIGDYCTHPSVCMQDSLCKKSKCTCKEGFMPRKDKISCVTKNSDNSAPGKLTGSKITCLAMMIFTLFNVFN